MKKIDKAVEIIRGWSDEELKYFLTYRICPDYFKLKVCEVCDGYNAGSCVTGWNTDAGVVCGQCAEEMRENEDVEGESDVS